MNKPKQTKITSNSSPKPQSKMQINNTQCSCCTGEFYHLKTGTFMCYNCIFDREMNQNEFIRKNEKEELDNWKVNANVVRKSLLVHCKDTEYKNLAKDETKQKEYVDFLVKVNNKDVEDYVSSIKSKYEQMIKDITDFLGQKQQNEIQNLYAQLERQKEEILDCQKNWKEIKDHYGSSGIEKVDLIRDCLKSFGAQESQNNVKDEVQNNVKDEVQNNVKDNTVQNIIQDYIIQDFELYINGEVHQTYNDFNLIYHGTTKNSRPHGYGIVYSCTNQTLQQPFTLFCGEFKNGLPDGRGVLFCAAKGFSSQKFQGRIRYFGNFNKGFFHDSPTQTLGVRRISEKCIFLKDGPPRSEVSQRRSYNYGIMADVRHGSVLFNKNTKCEKMTAHRSEVMGVFGVNKGIIESGKIKYTVSLLGGKFVDLEHEDLLYQGELAAMQPCGEGVLLRNQQRLFKGKFTQPLSLSTLTGTTYAHTDDITIPHGCFFGIKHEIKNEKGKDITDAYYFGNVVDGEPEGLGELFRYSCDKKGYTYIGKLGFNGKML